MANEDDLVRRIRHLVHASRAAGERQAGELVGVDEQMRTNVALRGWLTGLENAMVELAREVERLSRDRTRR
jgi:hypothetical protein